MDTLIIRAVTKPATLGICREGAIGPKGTSPSSSWQGSLSQKHRMAVLGSSGPFRMARVGRTNLEALLRGDGGGVLPGSSRTRWEPELSHGRSVRRAQGRVSCRHLSLMKSPVPATQPCTSTICPPYSNAVCFVDLHTV